MLDYTSVRRLRRNVASVIGPGLIYPGQSGNFTITNYDDFHDWSVETDKGSVSRNGNTVTLDIQAGESAGIANMMITRNGISAVTQVAVGAPRILKPSIQSPLNSAVDIGKEPVFYGSTYDVVPAGHESLVTVTLRIATDAAMTNVIHTEASATETIALPDTVLSDGQTTYYADLQYQSATLNSERSDVMSFTTKQTFIGPGTVIDGDIVAGQINGNWLLVADKSKRIRAKWGLKDNDTELVNIPDNSPEVDDGNTGNANTDTLVSPAYSSYVDSGGSTGSPTANHCRGLGYDFPNKQEVMLILSNAAAIDAADTASGAYTLTSIIAADHGTSGVWTSTEINAENAWIVRGNSLTYDFNNKLGQLFILPTKTIPV